MRLHILYRILNQLFVHRSDNDFTRFGINTGAKFIFAAQIYQLRMRKISTSILKGFVT